MTPEQIVQALQQMEPEHLKRTAEMAARMFAQKAEAVYDQDPENNGRKAQPYADIAHLLEEASLAFEEEPVGGDPAIDDDLLMAKTQRPTTVTEAVQAKADPWGGR